MMKKYVKPELFYERYELSQQIAANCANQMDTSTLTDKYSCGFTVPGLSWTIIDTSHQGCEVQDVENYCYFPGTEMYVLYIS